MTELPHFSLPFRFGTSAAVNEQDSVAEIADCALAIMLCPLGYRVELPSFGLPDPAFSSPAVDTDEIRRIVHEWEPRAALRLAGEIDPLDALIERVQTIVQVQTEE